MSIRYKAVKQVSGFDKTATGKYAVETVTSEMPTFGALGPGESSSKEDGGESEG